MSKPPTIKLVSQFHRDRALEMVRTAPDGWHVSVREPTRNLDQNARLHAMLSDIRKQVEAMWPFSIDDMKKRFMHALGHEMRYLPSLEGDGFFPVGLSTKDLTVSQFSLLIELVFKYGAEHSVKWTEPVEY